MSDANRSIAQNYTASKGEVRRFNEAKQRTQKNSAPTLADVLNLIPTEGQIAKIVPAFGLETIDPDEITGAGANLIRDQYTLFSPHLVSIIREEQNFMGLKMHLDRMVDGIVRSAFGSAQFYEKHRAIAKDAADSFANEDRDEDRMGVDGGENRVIGLRRIAAENGAKAYALACLAQGACAEYETLMGEAWKPYVKDTGRSLAQGVAAAQADALGF
ncbi:hypothetical protein [Neokomagataea anthophila]|uniref:Uncharacterized protein n=2 Tax=Neokomagataea anthophila TaxID=2826925 RepID=A0ABS5E9E4_9PROT|nr:hypothetical protein [Neokomagataea anthophila]MBR0560533.1 hypothetical protein [Neokomagataea anthophila]